MCACFAETQQARATLLATKVTKEATSLQWHLGVPTESTAAGRVENSFGASPGFVDSLRTDIGQISTR